MSQNKKDFKVNNPALSFISAADHTEEAKQTEAADTKKLVAPEGYKVNPMFIEVKSKRVQLILQPSVVSAIKELAKKKGLSMNETINEAIQEYLERH